MLMAVNPEHPEPRKIARAVAALEAGEVIAYPTDTAYGLGCDARSKKAVDKLYAIKGMDRAHPLAFICPDLGDIARFAIVEKYHYRILRRLLPGPYCFILDATREVPKMLQSKRRQIGIRVPANEICLALTRALGHPIASTTAQRAGDEKPHVDPREVDYAFPGLALVIDGGAGGELPSTIVDLTTAPPEIIREGAGPIDSLIA
ncbi:MAG TPA: L-threonylcarbamoyladenylate synthase [Polyangiaceae bacterium]|jgi:tRNA threonylcarbamoyl adenosine modification protein (Sua5/YciO/YrdC/YwlC family)|nr:L-threonylcarbamoyladenylate synthase [Polyangiaceae bacterium]